MANTENTRERKLKYAFGAHASAKELHVTSDDSMFFTAADAANHAKSLDDSSVKTEERSDYVRIVEAAEAKIDNQLDLEREVLRAKHKELFGNLPTANAGLEKLKAKVAKEEARRAEAAAKDAEAAGTDAGPEGGADPDTGGDGGAGE